MNEGRVGNKGIQRVSEEAMALGCLSAQLPQTGDRRMCAIYTQLSLDERKKIERWRNANVPVTDMARVLKRHRSTILREIRRNHSHDADMPKIRGYFAMAAQARTAIRHARQ